MSDYRRAYIPGGTFFFTIVTYQRQPLFNNPENISKLRQVMSTVKTAMPFEIVGAIILPEHLHFLWTLPPNDTAYSQRIGRLKVLFTHSLRGQNKLPDNVSTSRQKHRESDVWQRRFWEHNVRNEKEFEMFLNYIHYNPVKHGLVSCPHLWEYSSFHRAVKQELYSYDWGCVCQNQNSLVPNFDAILDKVGE